ncbi:hypothetical protein Goshw_010593 [Gossypium schwendimanii]|uniref:Uncharacterized protein n=1 Tax=Gossypium schwendimanii TaxID=34291 RepID=A0A7J9NCH5_GOSSC|nr:hypothetical protein [Gossypium schwendimanii]
MVLFQPKRQKLPNWCKAKQDN